MERNYIKEKKAAVKEFEDKKVELKEKREGDCDGDVKVKRIIGKRKKLFITQVGCIFSTQFQICTHASSPRNHQPLQGIGLPSSSLEGQSSRGLHKTCGSWSLFDPLNQGCQAH